MNLRTIITAIMTSLAAVSAAMPDYTLTERRAARSFAFGEWAQAGALYELLLDERPDCSPVYSHAIVAASLLGDTTRSVDLLERAMAHGVALDSVVEGVRAAAFGTGSADVYADFLHRTRKEMPWMARAIDARLLDYYAFRGDGRETVRIAESMLSGLPGSLRYLSILARGHAMQGNDEDAEKTWRRILAIDPDNLEALRALGCRLAATGRTDEARPLLERAQGIDPTPYVENILHPLP